MNDNVFCMMIGMIEEEGKLKLSRQFVCAMCHTPISEKALNPTLPQCNICEVCQTIYNVTQKLEGNCEHTLCI